MTLPAASQNCHAMPFSIGFLYQGTTEKSSISNVHGTRYWYNIAGKAALPPSSYEVQLEEVALS